MSNKSYKSYVLIRDGSNPESLIQLVLLHDENHPELIGCFPHNQKESAQFCATTLNKHFGYAEPI